MSKQSETEQKNRAHQTPLADVAYDKVQEEFRDLAGLNDECVKRLSFVLIDKIGIKDFELEVIYGSDSKKILIHAFDSNGRKVGVKMKDHSIFDKLAPWLGTEAYKIEFAHKETDDGRREERESGDTTADKR